MQGYRAHWKTSKAKEWSWSSASLSLNYRGEEIELVSFSLLFGSERMDSSQPYPVLGRSWAGHGREADQGQL